MAESTQQRILAMKLQELRDGKPQSEPFEHALHCLDSLRQEVLCNADDTPRWSGYHDKTSGVGQYRLCKDWGRLEAFAKENYACHRHIDLRMGRTYKRGTNTVRKVHRTKPKSGRCMERWRCGDNRSNPCHSYSRRIYGKSEDAES